MADTAASTTVTEPKDGNVLEMADTLLVQGKRYMALEDYQAATDALEQAVQLYDAHYGVAKIQCADAYLEYGLALVALANLEAGSGTDRLMRKAGIEGDEGEEEEEEEEEEDEDEEGGDEDDDGDNEDQEDQQEEEKMDHQEAELALAKSEAPGTTENGKTNGSVDKVENDKDLKTSTNGTKDQSTSDDQIPQSSTSDLDPTPGTSSGKTGDNEENDDSENDEATTIEIAWEVLCLAKRLFMTDESIDGRLKLAETLQKLGEISIEWDNNDNAVSILEECLNIRKAILPAEDRLIALTYYNLGLAHSFKSDIQNANENFQHAISVIEKRIESLTQDLNKAKSGQDTIAASSYDREINELKELLPDINMRMDDSKEDVSDSSEALKRTRDEIQQEDDEVKKVCLDRSKPVDDISHLVKRKAT